jgi:hypothetical protein
MSAQRHRVIVASGSAIGLLAVAAVGLVALTGKSAPAPALPSVAPAVTSPFPAPPRGAVVFAREDRADVLALAVVQQAHRVLLRASVLGPGGTGVRGLRVSLAAGDRNATQRAPAGVCGAGCYQSTFALRSPARAAQVIVRRPSRTTTWNVKLPATAPGAASIVARATRVWTHLRSMSYLDRLSSDPAHTVVSHWQIVAPDRLAYEIGNGGGQSVIVGQQRWDRSQGGAWQKSSALRLHQPQPFWVAATDAHVIASGRIAGRPVWRVSFFDPKTPGWFLASIDKATARTLDVRMWAASHFMHDTYGQFNAPLKIIPPAP